MTSHDLLAYAIARSIIGSIRRGEEPWRSLFSAQSYVTSSRVWPVPDFVIVDPMNASGLFAMAAEFKPPDQTKREYVTGLGQAVSYTRDFHYGLLILPDRADDNYLIGEHIAQVLDSQSASSLPIGIVQYDAARFQQDAPLYSITRLPLTSSHQPRHPPSVESSFYAKWREASPAELGLLLRYLYDERFLTGDRTPRERAFARFWNDVQSGQVVNNWAGVRRSYSDTTTIRTGVYKNYSIFLYHIGWIDYDGALTSSGLKAHGLSFQYGSDSVPFTDYLAKSLLLDGKHLVLFRVINDIQHAQLSSDPASFSNSEQWIAHVENELQAQGLLKRNVGRSRVATQGQQRAFFKAENQLWRRLNLIVPRGNRVFHPHRGYVINWSRITDLIRD